MDQELTLCPNVLRQCVCKLTHALQYEEVGVPSAKVYRFIYCPVSMKRLNSAELSFLSIILLTSMKVFGNSIYGVVFNVLKRSGPA